MNAKWLIICTGLDALTKESWRYYRPDENAEIPKEFKKAMYKLYHEICNITTVESEYMIEVKETEPGHIDVYADDCNGNDFSLHFIKWEEVLGYEVFEYTISKVGRTRLAAALLYEITWFGFTDYDNNKAIKEFNEELKRIEKFRRK